MPRAPLTYRLTPALVAAHAGGPVVCLAVQAEGQMYRLHAERPRFDATRDLVRRADVIGADGTPLDVDPENSPLLARVHIAGPLESECGYQGECGGWCDGYGGKGGIIDRMTRALAEADVLLTVDSPGGSVIGLPECVAAILAAKAQHGRRIYVVVTGWAASAAYWISACVADPGEMYVSTSAMAGNIGARAAHCNEAGALAQAGLEITDFAYPPGKIALSPNRAPTEAGIARGERDVMAAFEAFAAAVGAARPALTRKAIVDLDGDLLTGAAAVARDLADAVVSGIEDVEAWALAQAATPKEISMSDPEKGPPSQPGGRAEKDPEKMAGCQKCGEDKPKDDARYCMKCGTKFPDEDPEKDPDSTASRAALAARGVGAGSSAHMPSSVPGLKAALVEARSTLADVTNVLMGARSKTALGGKVEAVVADAAKAVRYQRERNEQRAENEKRERIDILKALADRGVHTRGEVLVDILDERTGKPTGKVKPAPLWGDGPEGRTMANLRGYAAAKLGAAGPAKEGSPYDRAPVEANADAAQAQRNSAAPPVAKKSPAVRAAAKAGVNEDEAAAILDREFGGAA